MKRWSVNSSHGQVAGPYTSKRVAYRKCRELNGKKAGGKRPYHVQRVLEKKEK
jgi:hypothetical protein